MKYPFLKTLPLAATAIVVGACGDSTSPDPVSDLQETSWVVESVTTASGPNHLSALGLEARLNFGPAGAGNTLGVGGRWTCNFYGGQVDIDRSTMRFRDMIATEMACPGPAGSIEAAFFEMVGSDAIANLDGDNLVIEGVGATVRLRREM